MSRRIEGIQIKIGGDTSNLNKALQGVNRQIAKTQYDLRDINKLLKVDPGNTELIAQKYKALDAAMAAVKDKLELMGSMSKEGLNDTQLAAFNREVIEAQQKLTGLNAEFKSFYETDSNAAILKAFKEMDASLATTKQRLKEINAALKLDPSSVDLLTQKEKLLAEQIETTKQKIAEFGNINSEHLFGGTELDKEFAQVANVVDASLKQLETEYKEFGSVAKQVNEQSVKETVEQAKASMDEANKSLDHTSDNLKRIEALLEMDPGNVDLIAQKEELLAQKIEDVKNKITVLKQVTKEGLSDAEWDNVQLEVQETEAQLNQLEAEYKEFGSVAKQVNEHDVKQTVEQAKASMDEANKSLDHTSDNLKRIEALLEMDPGKLLAQKIEDVKNKITVLKQVTQEGLSTEEWDDLQIEVQETEAQLKQLEAEYEQITNTSRNAALEMGERMESVGKAMHTVGSAINRVGQSFVPISVGASKAFGAARQCPADRLALSNRMIAHLTAPVTEKRLAGPKKSLREQSSAAKLSLPGHQNGKYAL